MHFKAAMTLLSWRELTQWMIKRGEEAAHILEDYVADRHYQSEGGFDCAVWDRTFPTNDKGMVTVRIAGSGGGSTFGGGGETQYDFQILEAKWFSYTPLVRTDFYSYGRKITKGD